MTQRFASLFRKKSHLASHGSALTPVLGAWDLTFLGIGAIIGTGIFVLTGHVAATQAGPGVILSFIVSGLVCALAALAYAELAACVGGCGSAYGYAYTAFGEVFAWMLGWDLILEYGISVAAVANGWSGYLVTGLHALGVHIPEALTKGPAVGGVFNLPAAGIILILMGLLLRGVKDGARLNTAMVFIKLLTIGVFIAVASMHFDSTMLKPFMPFGWFSVTETGSTVGVLAGASVVFFAYVGFDAVSTAVEETKDPGRNVPRGLLAALLFCTIIYIVVSLLLTGIVPYAELNVSSPVAYALEKIGISWAAALVSTGVIAGLTTVMLVLYYGLTRIIYAMARDGLLPKLFSEVDGQRHIPVKTTVICGLVMAILAGGVPLGTLAELVNIGTLAAFVVVCLGVIILRRRMPDLPRPFKAPGGLWLPALGALSCFALIAFLPPLTHLRFILWMAAGMLIYGFYSVHHSRLNPKNSAS